MNAAQGGPLNGVGLEDGELTGRRPARHDRRGLARLLSGGATGEGASPAERDGCDMEMGV